MYQGKYVLALIPARGGSKRLPRKNVLPLAGQPLIVWSIRAALAARYVDAVVVSNTIPVPDTAREVLGNRLHVLDAGRLCADAIGVMGGAC